MSLVSVILNPWIVYGIFILMTGSNTNPSLRIPVEWMREYKNLMHDLQYRTGIAWQNVEIMAELSWER
jgi:hypothetical protein